MRLAIIFTMMLIFIVVLNTQGTLTQHPGHVERNPDQRKLSTSPRGAISHMWVIAHYSRPNGAQPWR